MKTFLLRRWFLIALVGVLLVGMAFAPQLSGFAQLRALRYGIVSTVLFLMAFPLKSSAIWDTMRRPWAALLASLVNFIAVPIAAFVASRFLDDDLGGGLLVAGATPCTLASASVWTRRAGGNDSVAIMVTLLTNVSCFLITPLLLVIMLGAQAADGAESIRPEQMIVKLGCFVVTPMVLAQLLRISRPIGEWATANKTALGVGAQCGVLSMIFLGAINSGVKLRTAASTPYLDIALMVLAVCAVHLVVLWGGYYLAKTLCFSRRDSIAIGISGSQKTLMVGLQVAMDMNLSILPMLSYHVSQLFIDTLIADRWKQQLDAEEAPPPERASTPEQQPTLVSR